MPLLPTRMSSALAAAVFFSHSEKSSLMVRFNFFLCYFRRTCAKCTCGYFGKALFDGMPHVVSVFFSALSVEKEHRKQERAYAVRGAKNHIAIPHTLQDGLGYHRRYACMGKTIFMGTIKPNCFNLIGDFSSYRFFRHCHALDRQTGLKRDRHSERFYMF